MVKCFDCQMEDEDSKGWFCQFLDDVKIMRCKSCGEKYRNELFKLHYGKDFQETQDVDKQGRIAHAKQVRDIGLSPWRYQENKG